MVRPDGGEIRAEPEPEWFLSLENRPQKAQAPRMGVGSAREDVLSCKTRASSANFAVPLALVLPASSHLQAQPPTLLKRKGKIGQNKGIINMEIVSKPQSRRKPQLVFWMLWQKLPLCLQWLAWSTWPCALKLALRVGNTPTSPHIFTPPLALGTMPGLPLAVNHVARLREQSRRPPK
jgi:hypothetical protein